MYFCIFFISSYVFSIHYFKVTVAMTGSWSERLPQSFDSNVSLPDHAPFGNAQM